MVFKRLRYYSIIAILLCALILGFTFGGAASSSSSNIQPDVPEQIIPTLPDDNIDGEEQEEMPVFKNAYKLWEYSYDIFKNGAGYSAIMSGQASSQIGTQYMYIILQRNGPCSNFSDNLEISYRKGTSSLLDNSCLVTYTDKDGVQYRSKCYNYVYPESFVVEGDLSVGRYTDRFEQGERDVHDFLLNISEETTKLVYFDRTKEDYYEFKVTMNQDAVPSSYYNVVLSSSYVDSIPQSSINISITFKISKVNGHLLSYVLDESFEVIPSGILGVVGNQHATNYITYTFYEMDKEQNIENPFTAFGY